MKPWAAPCSALTRAATRRAMALRRGHSSCYGLAHRRCQRLGGNSDESERGRSFGECAAPPRTADGLLSLLQRLTADRWLRTCRALAEEGEGCAANSGE